MLIVVKTRSCPYCGAKIDSFNALYNDARFRLGPPVRPCAACGKTYIDPHFNEWAKIGGICRFMYLLGRVAAGFAIPLIVPTVVYYWWALGSETPRKPEEADYFFHVGVWGYFALVIISLLLIWRNTRIQIRNSLIRDPYKK